MVRSRGTDKPDHNSQIYLTAGEHHIVDRVIDIGSDNELALHIRLEHLHTPHRIKSAMGRQHLMLHAIKALEKDADG